MIQYKEFYKKELHPLKNANVKPMVMTEIDAPPQTTQHIQPAAQHAVDKGFIDYIKSAENAGKVGFKNGKWYAHNSPEGGTQTIAYGHKLGPTETYPDGITDQQADKFLQQDLAKAESIVDQEHLKWINRYIKQAHTFAQQHPDDRRSKFLMSLNANNNVFKLSQKQKEMLTDFAFNLGTLKKFPKLTTAIFRQDWKTVDVEYKRTYKDASGHSHELTRRNQLFFNRFLKDVA